jgi:predicted Zn-dependent protease
LNDFRVALVPVGRVATEELEAAAIRAARVIRSPIEVREPLPVPHGTEDPARGQHRAATFLERLSAEVLKLKPGRLHGADVPGTQAPPKPGAFIFVTDVDLFTAKSDGTFAALLPRLASAVVSVRRQREAFHGRRADPQRQRERLAKEVLRMVGRLRGLAECADPECALSPTRSTRDLDVKEERFCRACEARLFEGRLQL